MVVPLSPMKKVLFGQILGSIRHQEGTQRWISPKCSSKMGGGGYMCLFWVKNRTKLGITIFGGTVGRTWAGHYFNLGCLERWQSLSTPFKIIGGGDSDCQSWTLVMENHEKNGKFRQKRMNFTTNHLFQSVIDTSTGKEIEIHFQIRHFGKDWSNASKVIQEKPRKKRGVLLCNRFENATSLFFCYRWGCPSTANHYYSWTKIVHVKRNLYSLMNFHSLDNESMLKFRFFLVRVTAIISPTY